GYESRERDESAPQMGRWSPRLRRRGWWGSKAEPDDWSRPPRGMHGTCSPKRQASQDPLPSQPPNAQITIPGLGMLDSASRLRFVSRQRDVPPLEPAARRIADGVEPQACEQQREAGYEDELGVGGDEGPTGGDHPAPRGLGRRDAEPQEGE